MIIIITCASLAQLVEHFTRNEGVAGSSPAWSLRYEKASFISTVKLLEPVFASLMAAIIFYEIPSQSSVIGGLLIIVGIVTYIRYAAVMSGWHPSRTG